MPIERNPHPTKNIEWEVSKLEFYKLGLKLDQMINAGKARVQWFENEKGNLESIKVFKNDGTLIFFADLKGLSHSKIIKAL